MVKCLALSCLALSMVGLMLIYIQENPSAFPAKIITVPSTSVYSGWCQRPCVSIASAKLSVPFI